MNAQQLVLPLQVSESKTFEGFVTEKNSVVLDAIESASKDLMLPGQFTYLYGDQSTGKTHLLLASANNGIKRKAPAYYLDLYTKIELSEIVSEMNQAALICLDHVDAIAGDELAEKSVLNLIEHIRNNGGSLIAAGRRASKQLAIQLPDLLSRITAWPSYKLVELSEPNKQQVLKQAAQERGFELPQEVSSWLLTHRSRDLGFLLDFLDRIDTLSLAQKRRVTIPLIKTLGQH